MRDAKNAVFYYYFFIINKAGSVKQCIPNMGQVNETLEGARYEYASKANRLDFLSVKNLKKYG